MWLLYTATYVWKLHLWGALWGAACPVVGAWRRASAQPAAARPAGAAMGAARHTQEPTRVAVAAAKVLNFTVQLYGGVYYCADRAVPYTYNCFENHALIRQPNDGYARAYKCIQL